MQYILTQEEYDGLLRTREHELKLCKKKLQELCTKICDTMPVDWGWGKKGDPEYFKPWGCILTADAEAEKEGNYNDEWYCDECPVQTICPNTNKSWSK